MGTLTDAVISTTYKKLVFQKTDNKIYYTNGSDVDTEITTFATALTLSGKITASAGIQLSNSLIYDSGGNEGIKVTATGSAVNYLDVVNSATGNAVKLDVEGSDTNIGLTLDGKGSGVVTSTPQFVATAGVKFGNNTLYASDGGTIITLDPDNDVVTLAGDLVVEGDDIFIGGGDDATDKTITFRHDSCETIIGIDDSQESDAGAFIINTDNAGFNATKLSNDFLLDGSGNLHLGNGELRLAKIAYTDGDDAITIADGGGITTGSVVTTGGALTVAGNLTLTGARDIIFTDASGLEIKDTGGSTYFAMISDTIAVSQPMTCAGQVLFPGNSGVVPATGIHTSRIKSWIETIGAVTKTSIIIDLEGLASVAVDKDVIGLAAGGSGPSYLGQILAAGHGVPFAIQMTCLEAPATGSADIDLYNADEATWGYSDALVSSSSTEYLIVDGGGAWTNGMVKGGTTLTFGATEYLYLTNGAASGAGTYSTGKFLIEIWGTV